MDKRYYYFVVDPHEKHLDQKVTLNGLVAISVVAEYSTKLINMKLLLGPNLVGEELYTQMGFLCSQFWPNDINIVKSSAIIIGKPVQRRIQKLFF